MKLMALDTETKLISRTHPYPPMVCLSYAKRSMDGGIISGVIHVEEAFDCLLKAFESCADGEVELVFHNCAYDLRVIANQYPELVPAIWEAIDHGKIVDTSHMYRLIEYATKGASEKWTSLAALAKKYLKITLEKEDTWRMRYGELLLFPVEEWPDDAYEYARLDAEITLRVAEKIFDNEPEYFIAPAYISSGDAFTCSYLTQAGFPVNKEELEDVRTRCLQRRDVLLPDLLSSGIVNLKKIKKKATGLIEESLHVSTKTLSIMTEKLLRKDLKARGVKLPKHLPRGAEAVKYARELYPVVDKLFNGDFYPFELTPKAGTIKITEKLMDYVLQNYADDEDFIINGVNVLRLYDEYKTIGSFLGSKEDTGRIADLAAGGSYLVHSTYDVLKSTWRKGSSNPNLQNIPKKGGLRECIDPGDDYYFAVADFSGLELYAIAQVCIYQFGVSKLGDMLRDGVDVHSMVGGMFAGHELKTDEDRALWRTLAKAYNFGYWGGLGYTRFNILLTESYGLKALTKEEFKAYSKAYCDFFPEIIWYRAAFKNVLLVRHFGSNHYRLLRNGWDPEEHKEISAYCKRMNTRFQCLGAVAAKAALRDVTRAWELGLAKAEPLADIHDEIVARVPRKGSGRHAVRMARMMEKAARRVMPDVNPKVEVVLTTHWAKDAKPIWKDASHKELKCWTPSMRK